MPIAATRIRLLLRLAAIVLPVVAAAAAAQPAVALAQPLPQLPSMPGLDQLLADPGKWLTDMFNAALISLGNKTTGDVVGFMNWLMGSGNVISQTPAELSYSNPAVTELWNTMDKAGLAGLGAVTVWSGVNLIVHPHIRAPYHGALELIPRVVLGGILVHSSLGWGTFVIELNNALCREIGGAAMPAWTDLQQQPPGDAVLLNLIAMAIYLVLGLMLLGQMLMRLALVDALLVIAPLALLCWVVPQTYAWARLWFSTFFGTVLVQAIQVLVLRLGADLIQRLPGMLSSIASDPGNSGHVWLTTLLLGMAVLQLTRKIPRLMPGMPAGMGAAYAGPTIRQLGALFSSGKGGRNSK
jgi:hypothetical protein